MRPEISNETADSVCRVLSTALLADGDLDEPELRALSSLQLGNALGIGDERFRAVLHEVCRELLCDDACGNGLSMLEPERISEALAILHEPDHRLRSTARLIDLLHDGDPIQLECKLRNPSRLDQALDRIEDPSVRLWTCTVLLHLANADGELHSNELAVVSHVLQRWGITLESLRASWNRLAI